MLKELKVRVPYVTVWDGGTEIVTSGTLNIRTGEITDIETVDPPVDVEILEREYIILNGEQVDVESGESDGYWIRLNSSYTGPTESYVAHMDAMSGLSVTDLIKAVDYIATLSQFLNQNNEILDDMADILEPLNKVISELRTEETCGHGGCDSYLYKSDLPSYDSVCPACDENF